MNVYNGEIVITQGFEVKEMAKAICFLIMFYIVNPYCLGQEKRPERELHFTPAEVESMLFLYNQTTVKGSDVETVAPVGAKLKAGLREARALEDTTQHITLKLNVTEIQFCLNIISGSTFEAKYAELVLGMKRKLERLLPSTLPAKENTTTVKKNRGQK